ncbi:group I truncated hemoglobin [Saccharopolyspora phatthalungensis]|uniref:Group 1 truncated hemoglobin n=1 Tax=Saccharopolyspora phatthalungensis TaxID=664693 RepID=A0A840QJF6_9PSEU|nr:group 1 truncated hemoglobin [Saccharopolyspora phatthalungensis]MBB5159035.1 hemoglobin [Saccharopolyspora phatthalungensis]
MSTGQTLYEEVGGKPAVKAIVENFYDRILADPNLTRFFEGKDMKRIKSHQRALVTVALGGASETYTGKMMGPAHAGLAIDSGSFDRVLQHLADALTARDVRPITVEKVLAILEALRKDIVQAQPVLGQ